MQSPIAEKIRIHSVEAIKLKVVGNDRLKSGNYQEARDAYVEALRMILAGVEELKKVISENESEIRDSQKLAIELDTVKKEIEEIRLQLISNLALTEVKLGMWSDALNHSNMVLAVDIGNAKALFRRSVARIRLSEQLDEAMDDLKKLSHISQHATLAEIEVEMANCKLAISKQKESEFQSNIRDAFTQHTTVKKKELGFIDGVQAWFASMGSVLAQCGGVRPVRRSTKKRRN